MYKKHTKKRKKKKSLLSISKINNIDESFTNCTATLSAELQEILRYDIEK
jgi:hypothetical protein